jgi:hypothetical protein
MTAQVKYPTGDYSVSCKGGSPTDFVFPEKPLKAKPFCAYPYAFINKYGSYVKPMIDPTYVKKTYPNFS